MSIGSLINSVLDKFLPDVVGDIIGAAVDGATGNLPGAAANGLDAVEDILELAGGERPARFIERLLGLTDEVVDVTKG